MHRSIVVSTALLFAGVFVGCALKAEATGYSPERAGASRPAAAQIDSDSDLGYWAAWAAAAAE
jgi:hypothetical protein